MVNILFVCAGNICRSPALAAALQKIVHANSRQDKVYIDSCGINSMFLGSQADQRMAKAAEKRGILIDHRAKLFEETYFQIFNYIFVSDQRVLEILQAIAKSDADRAKIHLATEFTPKYQGQDVPDPFFQGEPQFDKIAEMAEEISQAIFDKLIKS
jgi:protein-tyrosine phosphatase